MCLKTEKNFRQNLREVTSDINSKLMADGVLTFQC